MEEKFSQPLVLGFGNPLLDMTIVVKDTSLHNKFSLPRDGQLEVLLHQRPVFDLVMESKDVQYTPGGCALNTLRVYSWVLGKMNKAIFVGGIGMDDKAEKLKSLLEGCGVTTRFVFVKDKPTGSCAALVLGAQRCLCADIGAASVCGPEHVFDDDTCQQMLPTLNAAPVVYLEGYFITHSFETALKVARHCHENGKLFIFNLCGSYVCENNVNELSELLPYVDILFGYIEEYKTLQRFITLQSLCEKFPNNKENLVHDLKNVFQCLSGEETPIKKAKTKYDLRRNGEIEFTEKRNSLNDNCIGNGTSNTHSPEESPQSWQAIKQSKLIVVTQGPSPLLYTREKRVFERAIAPLHPSNIIDTTGAGDSFVGGFLAAAANGEKLESCLDCGVWTAQQLLQEKGCTIPITPATFL